MCNCLRARLFGFLTASFMAAQAHAMDYNISLPALPSAEPDLRYDRRFDHDDAAEDSTLCLERDTFGWRSRSGGTSLSLQTDGSLREPTLMVVLRISLPDGKVSLPHTEDNCYSFDGLYQSREERRRELQSLQYR